MRVRARLVLAMCVATGGSARAQSPLLVTTDTLEYCSTLASNLARQHSSETTDVRQMVSRGRQMCDKGQVSRGIRLLREALMLLKQSPP